MKKLSILIFCILVITAQTQDKAKIISGPHYDEGPENRYETPYSVITYNQEIKAPLPGLAYDYKLLDWDKDGLLDVLALLRRGYGLVVYKNIGTAENPLFRSLQENQVLFRDEHIGRGFAHMEDAKGQITFFCFEYLDKDTSKFKKAQNLKAYINSGDRKNPSYKRVDVLNKEGKLWMAPKQIVSTPMMDAYDWDGDGKEDLIISVSKRSDLVAKGKALAGFHDKDHYNPEIAQFWFLKNISLGEKISFDEPVVLQSGGKPIKAFAYAYPEVVDLNGDGLPELLVGQQKPEIKVFSKQKDSLTELNQLGVLKDEAGKEIKSALAFRVTAGDLNNDGKADLISSSYFGNNSRYLYWQNNGSADFLSSWKYSGELSIKTAKGTPVYGLGNSTIDPVDWDGDGDLDLLLGGEPGVPTIVINSGSDKERKFEAGQKLKWLDGSQVELYSIEMGQGSMWGALEWYNGRITPRAVDWDGDSVLDLISGSMSESLYWLKGEKVNGELRFHKPQFFELNDKKMYHPQRTQVAVTDWDSDGKPDIIGLSRGNVITVFFGEGSSHFKKTQKLQLTSGDPLVIKGRWGVQRGGRSGIAFADWNGDGFKDIVTSNFHLGVFVHFNDGKNKFTSRTKLLDIFSHNTGVNVIDWDHDGELEILLGGDERRMIEVDKPAHLYYFKRASLGIKK